MRHIQNNYQYMTHVYEAGITNFELANLHMTKDGPTRSKSNNMTQGFTNHAENNLPKKLEPILGNVYGSLKRSSNNSDTFIYEYFEGSTNKIKFPLKFNTLLELFQ